MTGTLSRRLFLRRAPVAAALVASAVLAAPVADAAKPVFVRVGSPSPIAGAVSAAIAQHKRASRKVQQLGREWDRLWALPGRPDPKVRYAWLLKGRDADGTDIRTPLFAYSHQQIDKEVDGDIAIRRAWGTKNFSKAEERRAAMHRELTTLIRRQKAFDRSSGLTAISSQLDAAEMFAAEWAVAVLLAQPATAREAAEKAAYLKRHARQWLGYDDETATTSILLKAICHSPAVARRVS